MSNSREKPPVKPLIENAPKAFTALTDDFELHPWWHEPPTKEHRFIGERGGSRAEHILFASKHFAFWGTPSEDGGFNHQMRWPWTYQIADEKIISEILASCSISRDELFRKLSDNAIPIGSRVSAKWKSVFKFLETLDTRRICDALIGHLGPIVTIPWEYGDIQSDKDRLFSCLFWLERKFDQSIYLAKFPRPIGTVWLAFNHPDIVASFKGTEGVWPSPLSMSNDLALKDAALKTQISETIGMVKGLLINSAELETYFGCSVDSTPIWEMAHNPSSELVKKAHSWALLKKRKSALPSTSISLPTNENKAAHIDVKKAAAPIDDWKRDYKQFTYREVFEHTGIALGTLSDDHNQTLYLGSPVFRKDEKGKSHWLKSWLDAHENKDRVYRKKLKQSK